MCFQETHIIGYQTRAWCTICDGHIEESMKHILTDCDSPECKRIWQLAKALWAKKHPTWPGISLAHILGASLAEFKDAKGKPLPGVSRFYPILIAESAHLVWKLRCERRIQHKEDDSFRHTDTEIERRWLAAINIRLRLDCETTRLKYKNYL